MLAAYENRKLTIHVRCLKCRATRVLNYRDLERIADAKGMAYSLYNKRTRCRLTTGCEGWNVFGYCEGLWVYHLYDERQEDRWAERDRIMQERAREFVMRELKDAKFARERKKAMTRH
jgi:hypothetical protein